MIANVVVDRTKMFPLHVDGTVVAYGQFYGGLDGWEGPQGYPGTLLSRDRITVPIYAYLIDHPTHGLILVDAGISWEQDHAGGLRLLPNATVVVAEDDGERGVLYGPSFHAARTGWS